MQVRRAVSPAVGGLCAVLVATAAVLPAAELPAAGSSATTVTTRVRGAGLLLVRHAGTKPVTLDTTRITGPALRAWWIDAVADTTVDGGSVQRARSVTLFPPDTGDGALHDWTLIVVDATRGLLPPM